jgi:hypothetical protein
MHYLAVMITDTGMVMIMIRELKLRYTRKMITNMAMGTDTMMDISMRMSMNTGTGTVISLLGLLVTSTNMIISSV